MVDAITYTVGGVGNSANRELTSVTSYAASVSVVRSTMSRPGRHGKVSTSAVLFDEGKLAMEWDVWAPTMRGLEAQLNALRSLLARPGDVVVDRVVDGVIQRASCRLESMPEPVAAGGSPLATQSASLAIPGCFWRGPTYVESTPFLVSAPSSVVDSLAGSSAPIDDAVLRISGPVTGITITDAASGTGLIWNGILTAGQYLFLDAAQLTARVSTTATAWTTGGTDASTGIDYPGPGVLQLWPTPAAVDVTQLAVTVNVVATGATTATKCTVYARRSFL